MCVFSSVLCSAVTCVDFTYSAKTKNSSINTKNPFRAHPPTSFPSPLPPASRNYCCLLYWHNFLISRMFAKKKWCSISLLGIVLFSVCSRIPLSFIQVACVIKVSFSCQVVFRGMDLQFYHSRKCNSLLGIFRQFSLVVMIVG
jgi:hypothetical protein